MLHQDTEVQFINPTVGYGVIATKLIRRGTITWVQDDLDKVFSQEQIGALPPYTRGLLDIYGFTNKNGERILCWENGKYINHSFKPSCFATAYGFEIAVRDIHPGEELTDDYGYLNVSEPFHPADEGTLRQVVYADDILNFHREWDELIRANINAVFRCEQPLLKLVSADIWEEFTQLQDFPDRMRSIRNEYYDKKRILV